MSSAGPPRSVIEWGWAGSSLEAESGDLHLVAPFADGVLVALIDGIGHGSEAALAAKVAASQLQTNADHPVRSLVERCHEAMHGTRGAVMGLASFRARNASLSWTGVGNIDGVLLRAGSGRGAAGPGRAHQTIMMRGGVVGHRLPPLRADTLSVSPGDTLIMATDGIRSGFTVDLAVEYSAQEIAESILARFARGTDDARVVVARYVGAALE